MLFTAALVAAFGLGQVSVFAQGVRETPATIALSTGGNPQGFIQGSNAQGVIFSTVSGQPGKLVPFANIRGDGLDKLIRTDMRAEALADGRALFAERKYREAASAFGKVADAFGILLAIPQNFAAEARFFQIESLRRAGAFAELGALLETPAGKIISTHLGENYQRAHIFQKLWALYGAKKMDALKAELDGYQTPQTGDAKLLQTPNFKPELPTSEIAQLAFMRAKIYEGEGDQNRALEDYYRVFSLTYANDPFLAKQSMGAAMVIQKKNPNLNDEKNKAALREMQGLAYMFSKHYGASSMPAAFKDFAVKPKMPKALPPPKKEGEGEAAAAEGEEGEKKTEEEGAAPAEGEEGKKEMPADGAQEKAAEEGGEKGKGAGKAEAKGGEKTEEGKKGKE